MCRYCASNVTIETERMRVMEYLLIQFLSSKFWNDLVRQCERRKRVDFILWNSEF